jgi:hypothetical protein
MCVDKSSEEIQGGFLSLSERFVDALLNPSIEFSIVIDPFTSSMAC